MNFFISNGAGSGGVVTTFAPTKKPAATDPSDDATVRPQKPSTQPATTTTHLVDLLQDSLKAQVNFRKAASHVEGDRLKNYYISTIKKNHAAAAAGAGTVIAFESDAPGTQFSAEV